MSKLPPMYGGNKVVAGRSVSKLPPVSTNQTSAQAAAPAATTGASENATFIDTYFSKVPVVGQPTDIIYNADRLWAKVTLTLETAGPVAVGNMATITPVLSGKGQLLETDVPAVFYIAKGYRLYVAASGINRIKRTIEALPWLETITGILGGMSGVSVAPTIKSKL